ncbi:cyclic nucleotide-binding domain protein [Capnocytophaga sp. oral taxon 863 str. F0517]|jgi:cyclic nucleotide-binding protein|uniref:Crp/Fnr family transcriptional regulator n=1 Tax=Capnocytophaga sp. oral taxon 863 TaxID=1227265 RepID=UPI00039795AC|nr:Crp/Fnr family transcriptional regulator [Capnocytophaga sp. oral taxon 863]ERI61410.1 cyclic nucleotide-binding domain protein [Capnocytophaga sp. oral taxon 863 str. F0517]
MKLIDYIHEQTQIDSQAIELLDNLFEYREYKKYSLLLKEGNRSKEVFYIEEGIIRQFYTKNKKDITHAFLAEDSFYMPIEPIYFHNPSPFALEALEVCKVRVANFSQVEQMIHNHPKLRGFMEMLLVAFLKNLTLRIYGIKFQTAQERYDFLLKNYPKILLRVPLGHVASFLGITQQTLSVIRAGKGN